MNKKSDHIVITRVVPRIQSFVPFGEMAVFFVKGGLMATKEQLKDYAHKMMFDMKEEEYDTLEKEFEIFEKQMDFIGKVKGIEKIVPMTFPYINEDVKLRDDLVKNTITTKEALKNCKVVDRDQVRVPKVVE